MTSKLLRALRNILVGYAVLVIMAMAVWYLLFVPEIADICFNIVAFVAVTFFAGMLGHALFGLRK
jgi:hypothetical protein